MKSLIGILTVMAILVIGTSTLAAPVVGPPFTPYEPPRHNVPDSGSTLPLLGVGIVGLFLVRRVAQPSV